MKFPNYGSSAFFADIAREDDGTLLGVFFTFPYESSPKELGKEMRARLLFPCHLLSVGLHLWLEYVGNMGGSRNRIL